MSENTSEPAITRRSSHIVPPEGEVVPPPVPPRPELPGWVDVATTAPRRRRGWLLPVVTGALGLVLGAILSAVVTAVVIAAQQEAEAKAAAVAAPTSVVELMYSTRSRDGWQSAEWDDVSASWGYHPDDGLDIIFELDD